jgi:hypothetical protein
MSVFGFLLSRLSRLTVCLDEILIGDEEKEMISPNHLYGLIRVEKMVRSFDLIKHDQGTSPGGYIKDKEDGTNHA